MRFLLAIIITLLPAIVMAQPISCPEGYTCVEKADISAFLQMAKDQKCRTETAPKIETNAVNVIVDRQGRIYGSGSDPKPFSLHIDWCNYQIDAQSQIKIVAAQRVEPTWGFRFRPKATFGFLMLDLITGKEFQGTLDGGVLIEPFYIQWVNFNLYVGVRSTGIGVGVDITKNMGAYLGYSISWASWKSNPFLSIYFAF